LREICAAEARQWWRTRCGVVGYGDAGQWTAYRLLVILSGFRATRRLSCFLRDPISRKIAEAGPPGAHDYLTKPVDKASLDVVLKGLRVAPSEDAISTIDELDRNQFMLAASPQMLRREVKPPWWQRPISLFYCSEKAAPERDHGPLHP